VRLIGRNDTSLAGALIVGIFILFHQPLQFVLDAARDVERTYHVDLVQSLLVLGVVFGFHQYRKHHEAKAEAVAAAAEAAQAHLRSQELERLVGLSRSLAIVNDFTGLNQTLCCYLPKFTKDHAFWLLIYQQGCWDVLIRDADDRRSSDQLESIAERALANDAARTADANCVRIDGTVCFPMMVGDHPVGVILVSEGPNLSQQDWRAVEAAAALVAISVRNVQALVEMRENSLRDGLTGCFNRAHALDTLNGELRRAQRARSPLSMVMFDIDKFKSVNDTYGHLAGDHLLAEVGQRLGNVLRTSDVKCRYGGDEFLVILPETPAAGARQVAESIRLEMSRIVLGTGDGEIRVTVSVGVATADHGERNASSLVAQADRALYHAKHKGRDQVCSTDSNVIALRLVGAAG
jgi:diguanylate cyclase (GGDEF)-like protein